MPKRPLSQVLVEVNRHSWEAMQSHRFVRDVEADRLHPGVLRRYLVYEGAFVATAIEIFAEAVMKAPGIAAQRQLIRALEALANDQVCFFEETFERLGIAPENFSTPTAVAEFRDVMRRIAAEGSYLDIATAMFCAEWIYWTWCKRAAARPIGDPPLRRWVDLHAAEDFAAQAHWLRDEVDQLSRTASPAEHRRLVSLFGKVLELEIAFHTAPYEDSADREVG